MTPPLLPRQRWETVDPFWALSDIKETKNSGTAADKKQAESWKVSSLVVQELHSGSPSRSSSSLSFQSTPPPQQSPASFGQPLLNGLSRGLSDGFGSISQAGSSALPMVGGLMASLTGSPQLTVNGVLGSLNGVIQSPLQNPPQPALPALRPQRLLLSSYGITCLSAPSRTGLFSGFSCLRVETIEPLPFALLSGTKSSKSNRRPRIKIAKLGPVIVLGLLNRDIRNEYSKIRHNLQKYYRSCCCRRPPLTAPVAEWR